MDAKQSKPNILLTKNQIQKNNQEFSLPFFGVTIPSFDALRYFPRLPTRPFYDNKQRFLEKSIVFYSQLK
jgi:hypothetical protein